MHNHSHALYLLTYTSGRLLRWQISDRNKALALKCMAKYTMHWIITIIGGSLYSLVSNLLMLLILIGIYGSLTSKPVSKVISSVNFLNFLNSDWSRSAFCWDTGLCLCNDVLININKVALASQPTLPTSLTVFPWSKDLFIVQPSSQDVQAYSD